MREAAAWLEHYRQFWDTQLDSLDTYLKVTSEEEQDPDDPFSISQQHHPRAATDVHRLTPAGISRLDHASGVGALVETQGHEHDRAFARRAGRWVLLLRFRGRQFHDRHLPADCSPRKTGLYLVRRSSAELGNRRHTGLSRPRSGHGSRADPRTAGHSRATCAG